MAENMLSRPLLAMLFVFEIALLVLFAFGTNYAPGVHSGTNSTAEDTTLNEVYPLFQDIHVMIFIGFGFLMTFLKKYGFSAVGFTYLVGAFALQVGILTTSFFEQVIEGSTFHTIQLDITSLVAGDFAAGSLLISFGALLGKVTGFQAIVLTIIHLTCYAINEAISVQKFGSLDVGGSIVLHTFGAYFGLAASWVISYKRQKRVHPANDSSYNGSSYQSDLFAMIGTVFLWLFWPSFNAALTSGGERHRVILNTVFSLCGSCIMAFVTSGWLRKKFNMVDVQNATLAGGVAIGAVANFNLGPAGALGAGMAAGFISVCGYVYVSPWLKNRFGLDDTCGVNNLHGMPGIFSAILSIIGSAWAKDSVYGSEFTTFFNHSPSTQALNQLYSLLCTLGISIGAGVVGGFVVSFLPDLQDLYQDKSEWDLEEDEEQDHIGREMIQNTNFSAGLY
eukprot:m.135703 g.135703  ORF g.135703 m.135703 type:complete len:449 (+) comp10150_c0_seq1:158-1504(+)